MYLSNWLDLMALICRNIKDDILTNIFHRPPILIIFNPDAFNPPFTGAFNEYFNVTTTSIINNYSNASMINYAIIGLSILLAGLDVIYSIIRILISTIFIGVFIGSLVFFGLWFMVTAARRWKLIIILFQNNDFTGIY
ncbi:predicted protein [Candida tropicalis MYA-3404]|uniref:Uncharacterized protein n=1 Tax=Candida tropicalis (strain ATCC MYA-3404 / T1) TaxID=294747 RepID=C5M848_CANTT|nr:predicted protein [Candida tropicalis MYA-3404]EER33752.1 predicted protein [Candida tropicalis MYA-3404]KAG4407600.1 hypothetical protein JTP64_003135 [Candida tropicalis]